MTALTTAAGFASLLTSYVQPIREFALFSAIGILFAMVVTLTFIPAVLVLRPVPARQQGGSLRSGLWARLVAPVARARARRPLAVVGAGVVVLVVSLVGVPRLEVETNLVSYFRPDSPVVRGTRLAEQFLGGTTPISVVIDTGVPDGVKEPEILRRLAALEADLAAMPEVSQPLSLAGVVAQVHQALNGDDPDAYRIPDSREAVAQELLLFDFVGGVSLDGLVSYDYQKTAPDGPYRQRGHRPIWPGSSARSKRRPGPGSRARGSSRGWWGRLKWSSGWPNTSPGGKSAA